MTQRDTILKCLEEYGGCTVGDIVKRTGIGANSAQARLSELYREGAVDRDDPVGKTIKINGIECRDYVYWSA